MPLPDKPWIKSDKQADPKESTTRYTRSPIAICLLIKNSNQDGATKIHYRDIGDYLSREEKLDVLTLEQSLEGTEWEAISPNSHGDWINHRDDTYDTYQPIGDKATKGKPDTLGVFETYSSGLKTNRDAWCYNFSRAAVQDNMARMVQFYNEQLAFATPEMDSRKISWNRSLLSDHAKKVRHSFSPDLIVGATDRPFTRQFAYFDRAMNDMVYQLPKIFPTQLHRNLAITLPGPGRTNGQALVMDSLPDLTSQIIQAFPLYTYRPVPEGELAFGAEDEVVIDGYFRRDNITDGTLATYRGFYEEPKMAKEDIFFYVYGLLHSRDYKETYKSDLMKMLPRIPKVKDFWGFSTAGRQLAVLHLNYENVEPYPLDEIVKGEPASDDYDFYRVNKLSFGARKDRSNIIYNQGITLAGIPDDAYEYQVNGKSALEWIIDRYQVTTHKDSQLTNDPNDYCREVGDPRYILDLIKRIVTVSVETMKIVEQLPPLEIIE